MVKHRAKHNLANKYSKKIADWTAGFYHFGNKLTKRVVK